MNQSSRLDIYKILNLFQAMDALGYLATQGCNNPTLSVHPLLQILSCFCIVFLQNLLFQQRADMMPM